jgi:hypothetical protein
VRNVKSGVTMQKQIYLRNELIISHLVVSTCGVNHAGLHVLNLKSLRLTTVVTIARQTRGGDEVTTNIGTCSRVSDMRDTSFSVSF